MPELPPPSGGHTGTAGPLRKYHPKDPAYPNHLALTLAIITLPLKILDRVANSALLDRVATASIRPTTPRGFFILPLVLSFGAIFYGQNLTFHASSAHTGVIVSEIGIVAFAICGLLSIITAERD